MVFQVKFCKGNLPTVDKPIDIKIYITFPEQHECLS